MKRLFQILLVGVAIFGGASQHVHAQDVVREEPDTAAFLASNFLLQSQYRGVRCVSEDNRCPAEISVTVPCLTATCDYAEQTYAIGATYATIQAASDEAQPGELIIITPGHYAGVMVEDRGGADGAYIHFLGWGDGVVVDRVADPTKSWLRHHFYFINTHHYLIQNISFTAADEGAGIFFSGYFSETGSFSHHMIVMDVYAHDNYSWGMHTTATSYVLVQDSVFTNSADEHGLYVSGSGDNMVIRRNVFQGNNSSGVQVNPDPQTATMEIFYWLQNSTGNTCDWTEDDVEFTGAAEWEDLKNCYDQQGLPDLGAFIEDGITENLIVEQNIITGNGAAGGGGINLASVRNSIIRNNLIYGNDAAGITCWDNAYAEEKGLASSQFGCQNVRIVNNTMVDESGGRGALIINHDARDMQVFNNIIVRDRYDAYEVAENSGSGLRSGNNYYFAQAVTDSPGFGGDENSITGFSILDALGQFVNPTFAPWILADGDGYVLNPARPDYRLRQGSVLANGGNPTYLSAGDLFGQPRNTEIGALTVGVAGDTEASQPMDTPANFAMQGTITYHLNGQVFMVRNGETINVSAILDDVSAGEDGLINISPDGQWILLDTTRFDPACAGWSCWVVLDSALTTYEVVYVDGMPLHSEQSGAIASGGNMLVVETDLGTNEVDLGVVYRLAEGGWSVPFSISAQSPYAFNRQPAISDDGQSVVYDCHDQPYAEEGSAICQSSIDATTFRVVLTPDNPPPGYVAGGALHHPDFAPDGSIVFEGDWTGEQLWRLFPDGTLQLINGFYTNDNSPCVLPNGSIASLWLNREGGQGFHELKLMSADGSHELMLLLDVDVLDAGLGCGQ